MPIRPLPRLFRCPACGWSKTVTPASDALVRGRDHFDACPQCGHAPLSSKAQPDLSAGVGPIANMLEKWLKR